MHFIIWSYQFIGTLKIPRNVREIKSYTFQQTRFTGELELPEKLTVICDRSFSNCLFNEVVLFDKIVTISSNALEGVNSIEKNTYHGTSEPSNCNEFNLQLPGISSLHVDPIYPSYKDGRISVYMSKNLKKEKF